MVALTMPAALARDADLNLAEQPLSDALRAIAEHTGENILFTADAVAGIEARRFSGHMAAREAVEALLQGTSLEVVSDDQGGLIVRRAQLVPHAEMGVPPGHAVDRNTPSEVEEVVVSASRIAITGYQQPTPVTVIGAAQLDRDADIDIGDSIRALPSVGASASPNNGTGFSSINGAQAGTDSVNLRNLGILRTLVLLDGQRVVQSNITGGVDLSIMPTSLVERIDIVTSGASAAWGSDAVAGVVNLVLNKNFTGFNGNIEAGDNTQNIHHRIKIESSWGADFDGGRGHLILSGQYTDSPDAVFLGQEHWYNGTYLVINPAYTATNGQPQLIHASNVGMSQETPGGVILSNPAGTVPGSANLLAGIQFVGPGATPAPFNFGNVSGGLSNGGSANLYTSIGPSDVLAVPYNTATLFGYGSYKLSDTFRASLQLNYGHSFTQTSSPAGLTSFTTLSIRNTNPYIPASIATQMVADGITSFTMGTTNTNNVSLTDLSLGALRDSVGAPINDTSRQLMRGVFNLDGVWDDNWSWKAYYQHGLVRVHLRAHTLVNANFANAIDAVAVTAANRGSSGLTVGSIACASTLTNLANGCQPLDVFGTGVATQAAINYINTDNDQETLVINEDDVSGSMQGTLPWHLPAGPIAVAFGTEYRKESGAIAADPLGAAKAYSVGNFTNFSGQDSVEEGFIEVDAPILRSDVVQSLDLNAAGRLTNYSTSGLVETWKLGLTSQVNDDIRLRTSWSLDIRAPNLSELFNTAGALSSGSAIDPKTGIQVPIYNETMSNQNLNPEVATTLSGGLVLTPHWLNGLLKTSFDWYSIDIRGAIFTTSKSVVLQQCNAGVLIYCSQLIYNGVAYSGALGTIVSAPLNAASATTSGLDFQTDYTMRLFTGSLDWHLVGNYTDEQTQTAVGTKTDYAGSIGPDSAVSGFPKFRATLAATYNEGPWSGTLQGRFIGAAALDNAWGANMVDDNYVPFMSYLDLRASYKWDSNLELYGAIDNVSDASPPSVPPSYSAGANPYQSLTTRADIYDALGRAIRVGIRVSY